MIDVVPSKDQPIVIYYRFYMDKHHASSMGKELAKSGYRGFVVSESKNLKSLVAALKENGKDPFIIAVFSDPAFNEYLNPDLMVQPTRHRKKASFSEVKTAKAEYPVMRVQNGLEAARLLVGEGKGVGIVFSHVFFHGITKDSVILQTCQTSKLYFSNRINVHYTPPNSHHLYFEFKDVKVSQGLRKVFSIIGTIDRKILTVKAKVYSIRTIRTKEGG